MRSRTVASEHTYDLQGIPIENAKHVPIETRKSVPYMNSTVTS